MFEVKIIRADTGGFVFVAPTKCLQVPTLETALSEVRSAFRQDSSENGQHESYPCPYCGSTGTIGHGLRETSKQVLTRRFCNSCKKTWVAGREPRIIQSTKTQVAFLNMVGYTEKEIAESVKRSKSTVRAHIENIEIAEYRAKKATAEQPQPSEVSAEIVPNTSPILAPEFDRAQALKERIGTFTVWNYNGRLAASQKGMPKVIYLTKDSILYMKKLRLGRHGKQKLSDYISQLPEAQRDVVSEFIETLIDEGLGMFPMLKVGTGAGDFGKIDADEHENGQYRE